MWWLIAVWLVAITWSTCGWAGAADDCYEANDADRNITGCTELIRLGKEQSSTYISRGQAYSGKGDFDRAIADYAKAIDLDPKSSSAYQNRGEIYRQKG
jgi:tetratricopeptide (TPR) repeat protein